MSRISADQYEKLPKYVRDELDILAMRLQEAKDQCQEYADKIEGDRVIEIHPYSDNGITLKGNARVALKAGDVTYTVRLGRTTNCLQVYSTESLSLEMGCSNTFTVRPADRESWGKD